MDVAIRLGGKTASILELLERTHHPVPPEFHRARMGSDPLTESASISAPDRT